MTVGLQATNLANKWLNMLRGTAFTAPTTIYAELHVADPGVNGTTGVSAGSTTRIAVTFNAAASGALALSANVGPWTNGGTSETLSHVAFFDASTAGNFLWSAAMGSTHAWASGDTFTLTSAGFSLSPLAA